MIGGLVLAAGGGSRFGSLKQLAELEGRPLVEHAVETLLAVPAVERIVVVLGAGAEEIQGGADLKGAEVLVAPDWEEGIAASLRAGIAALQQTDAALVVLADQPRLAPQVVAAVLDRMDGASPAVRATYQGTPGHPVLIKRSLFADVSRLRGDEGARDLLAAHGVADVECGHLGPNDDVDTPADLEAIRARN